MKTKMDLVQQAKEIAYRAHWGQMDKAGKPYYEHFEFVANHVQTDEQKCVAYLHDVMEDTSFPPQRLRQIFGKVIFEALCLMKHDKAVDYFDYVAKIAKNPLARAVKMADLTHNMQIDRLPNPTEKDFARLEKYKKAYQMLMDVQ